MKKKKWWKWLLGIIAAFVIFAFVITYFLFNFAFKRGGYSSQKGMNVNEAWIKHEHPQTWHEKVDGLQLTAYYLPAPKATNKTILIDHGYGGSAYQMNDYIKLFHDDGYNVIAPDNQCFGHSQGDYSGYGYKDRAALIKWMQRVNQVNPHGKIGMFGISMGASAVMFTVPKAPANVKFVIADCGYSSIAGELKYELNHMFHLPAFPILPIASLYSKIFAHYNFYDGDTKQTLAHNRVPLFIIHGSKDTFVPTKNAYENIHNDKGPKKLWIVKNAIHARSLEKEPQQYREKTKKFAEEYMK